MIARQLRVRRGYAMANKDSVTNVVPNEDGEHAIAWQADGLAAAWMAIKLSLESHISRVSVTWRVCI